MPRHPIARTASPWLLWTLAGLCGPTSAWPHDAAPAADAQCPPEFEAEQVDIEERGRDQVVRLTRAERARLWGDWLEGERIEVWVPAHAGTRRPAWSMQAAWLRRSLLSDEASFGPLSVQTADGAWLEGGCGAYDGHKRQLTLEGPVVLRQLRGSAEAAYATLLFAAESAEVEVIALDGDVRGHLQLGDKGHGPQKSPP